MKIDVSKLGYRWKGTYNSASTYAKGDVVKVGDETHVFTDSTNKRKFAVGQTQLTEKGSVAVDNTISPVGARGNELRSKATTIGGTATFTPEFRHSRDRNGTKVKELAHMMSEHPRYAAWQHVAVMTDGTARAWGYNAYGVSGMQSGPTATTNYPFLASATALPLPRNTFIKKAWTSYLNTFLLDTDNVLWSAGHYYNGSATHGAATFQSTKFTPISRYSDIGDDEIVEIKGGYSANAYDNGGVNYLARGASGKVYAWGANQDGLLGFDNNTAVLTPTLIPFTADHPMKYISICNSNEAVSYMIDYDGKLWASGSANRNFTGRDRYTFAKFDPWGSENVRVKQAWAHNNRTNGSYTTQKPTDAVLLEDGRLYIQGSQQGVYQYWNQATPRADGWVFNDRFDPSLPVLEDVDFYQGAAGSYTNFLAIKKDKTVVTTGHSPLNSSNTSQITTFETLLDFNNVAVANAVDIVSVGGRYGSCYAIRTSGGLVYVIGYSSKGQKGTGHTDQGASPSIVIPAKLPPVDQLVMTGYAHDATTDTCLIAHCTNGETYHWGYNSNYNLADGGLTGNLYAPVQVKF